MYNKMTNRKIRDDSIVSTTATGIVIFDGATWEFIPNEYISDTISEAVTTDIEYEKYIRPINELTTKTKIEEKAEITRYEYSIGLDFSFGKAQVADNAIFLSDKITVEAEKQTVLKAIDKTSETSSIEYYIVDGINTYPILPFNVEQVISEKIFPGIPLRFEADESKEQVIRINGEISNISLEELNATDINTISYYPKENSSIFVPQNSEIQVKIILRTYDKTKAAPEVLNITIEQYDRIQEDSNG